MSGLFVPPPPSLLLGAKFRTGLYYGADGVTNGTRATVAATNWYMPYVLPAAGSFDRISCEVTVTGTTAVIRLGVYADANGVPGALLLDGGALSVVGTGLLEATINASFGPGLVWLAFNQPTAVAVATVKATSGGVVEQHVGGTSGTDITQGNTGGYHTGSGQGDAGAYSATAILTGLGSSANAPVVTLRSK